MRASTLGLASAVALAAALAPGCGGDESMVRLGNSQVLYDGPPFGDMLPLQDQVRTCMHSDNHELPRVTLVDRIFECYTQFGWKQVYGCTGYGQVIMDAPYAVQSKGALWSHELTHFYGDPNSDNPCGFIGLTDFSISIPDAGRDAGH
jgi:hypothetical protein